VTPKTIEPAPVVTPSAPVVTAPVQATSPIKATATPKATTTPPVTTAPKLSRLERMQQYQQQAVTGTVSDGAAKTKLPATQVAAEGTVAAGAAPKQAAVSPAFKGDAYHPEIVEARIQQWQKLYATTTATAPARMTKPQAIEAAQKLGFELTNYSSHGQPVFRNGNRYITPDVDQHNGGLWKMADSPKALGSKTTRLGTFDGELNRIGD
jgi:phage tail sheath protein FI